jgi:hypothetical protein
MRQFFLFQENIMGNSLHNKIYLGRASVLSSRRVQAGLFVGTFLAIGLVWMTVRAFK